MKTRLHTALKAAATVLGLGLLGGAQAASGCTSLYATVATGGATAIDFVNTVTGTSTQVFAPATSITAINGMALNPVTGVLYYIDRTGNAVNTLYSFNPATGANTLIGAVVPPAGNFNLNIGASFDNSTSTPRLYLMYGNYVVQEVNITTGAVVRNITINLPGTDAEGTTLTKRSVTNGGVTDSATSGDLVFSGTTAYAALDTTAGGTTTTHLMTLGNLSSFAGTALTASNARRITLGGASIQTGITNGLAIMPSGAAYLTYNTGTQPNVVPNLGTITIGSTPTVPVTSIATNSTRNYSDLSDCVVAPDVPVLTKSFGTSPIYIGTSTTLTITLGNTNPSPYYTNAAITDTFPAGLVIATTPGLTTTCTLAGGATGTTGATATAGSGSVTLPSGIRVNNGGCSYTVNVTGQTSGSKPNVIPAGSVQSGAGNSASAATATLVVNSAVTGTLLKQVRNVSTGGSLGPGPINAKPGETLEYCLTATHPGAGVADATTATIRDNLSANLGINYDLVSGAYAGNDIRIVRTAVNAGTTYASFATSVSSGLLSVSAMPFRSGATVQACFQARVR